jgi:hypothetical protein
MKVREEHSRVSTLKNICLRNISRKPRESLTDKAVAAAFLGKRATRLLEASKRQGVGKGGQGIDTVRLRQRVLRELIEHGGRAVSGWCPTLNGRVCFFPDDALFYLLLLLATVRTRFNRSCRYRRIFWMIILRR